ncbi:sensor domain-containing diguanylate cyclase [Metabacillus malikii]|uniref:Diguanylate cyclase (GGDEF)-like protein n=1 Tax=Metabacillus malikii TaxID=1504265 RepID=A0ABT9ZI71_9BACI|nr:sensor domain-containing diguanylate cyclase [Metabacillus malikii]MDQ0231675.1 diguanylate cyclase (GGDEF)-like protein [Metabacillus malikii]
MAYKAATELLELVNLTIDGKMLFVGQTTEEVFTILKTLNASETDINLSEMQSMSMDIRQSFCQQIFFGGRTPLIINDTQTHHFTSHLPLTSLLNIGSYIGVPIFYQDGEMFGTLCAVDSKKSNFTEKDIEIFEKFSNLFSYVIELEKKVNIDHLTQLYNRGFLFDSFEYISDEGAIMLIDLDGFKQVNDVYGHDIGDLVLIEVGSRLKKAFKEFNLPIRLGGDEFVILVPNLTEKNLIETLANQALECLQDWSTFNYPIELTASVGLTTFNKQNNELQSLIKRADKAMYKIKQNGKNNFKFAEE